MVNFFRYAVHWMQELLESDPSILDHDDFLIDPVNFIDEEEEKRGWEDRYQAEYSAAKAEIAELENLPCLTYSSEDASRTWHGRDGQPMPLWTPPTPSMTSETDLVDHPLSFLYKTRLMDELELPPIFIKKETTPPPLLASTLALAAGSSGIKRTAGEAGLETGSQGSSADQKIPKYRRDVDGQSPLGPSSAGGGFAPRSLFERPQAAIPKSSKIRNRIPNRHLPPGVASPPTVPGSIPPPPTSPVIPGGINPVAGLRHPLPRPQVEAENVPEWLVQEDWALLYAVRELQELPVNLMANSPAHTANWDLISDIVNSVSRCYRGPRQCRNRYDTIILPREEGRIYDMPPSAVAAMAAAQAAANKKNKKKQTSGLKLSASTRPMKTSALYAQDNNTAWSAMYTNRFESIKAVANKRSPTTKPLVVNPSMKNSQHASVLSDSGITYDSPLNPIQVAANRADRIQREKQRTQQDQQQQLAQQRTAAAQAAAQAAASAAQQQTRIVTAAVTSSPQQAIVQQQQVQQQQVQQQQHQQQQAQPQTQTVVTSSPHPQAVVVGISQPMTTVSNAQLNNVIQSRIQQQQQQQQQSQTQQQLQQLRPTQQQTIGIQELVRVCTQQPTHSTVVVTSQPQSAVVSVSTLTPSQLQAAQKLVGQTQTIKGNVVTQGRALTPQQVNLLRQQQALMKKTAQDNNAAVAAAAAAQKARLQGMQIAGTSTSTGVVSGVTTGTITTSGAMATPQKVTVTAVSLTPSNLVTVVTQSGHPKTFIRQVSTGPGGKATTNLRTMTEADVKLLLAKQQQIQNAKGQQVTQLQVPAQSNLAAQLLAGGIHVQQHTGAGGAQVATLVKTVSASGSGGVAVVGTSGQVQPSVTIPVANVNLPQVKAALARSGVTNPAQMQLALRQQIIQQQRKPVTSLAGTQQKVTLGQVGAKGVPAQLIVSSSGAVSAVGQKQLPQQAVTVQQFQQIVKSVQQPGVSGSGTSLSQQQIVTHSQQQIMPHQVFNKQAVVSTFGGAGAVTGIITTVGGGGASASQTSTVQARVIPVSSTTAAGRMQQIQVVAATPTQVQVATSTPGSTNVRQISAPNVTVDASGRPTTGTFVTAVGGQHIRVATAGNHQQQFLTASGQNVAVAVRGPGGVITSHQQQVQQQQGVPQQTKLQVVGPSTSATAQASNQSSDRS